MQRPPKPKLTLPHVVDQSEQRGLSRSGSPACLLDRRLMSAHLVGAGTAGYKFHGATGKCVKWKGKNRNLSYAMITGM